MKSTSEIDLRRYRKVRWFVIRILLHALWWDLLLNHRWLGWLRPDPIPRYRRFARRYRTLALELGGVLIKLGQFLSIRVDLLPAEVIRELAGLQDEVPPEPFDAVRGALEEELGPLTETFARLDPEPVGAASLAQVHRARLRPGADDPGEEDAERPVVVKVLRPGIEQLVETDLAAVDLALRWLGWVKRIRRRVDVQRLAGEFRRTTRRELDLQAEADHAERFAAMFAGDPRVRVPRVHRQGVSRRVLILEDVGYFKVARPEDFEAAGIPRGEVAKALYGVYMEQIFEHHFMHADPHPGNLFVEPLPTEDERAAGRRRFAPGEAVPPVAQRPFRLAFVDFGMVAEIPPRLRGTLREVLIGLGIQDARRVIRAFREGGILLPEANLERLEEVHREVTERFWGLSLSEMQQVAQAEARAMLLRYRDVLYEMPFQMPVDLLFAGRAVGLLQGLATSLDPDFDPWGETLPYAQRMATEEARVGLGELFRQLARQSRALLALPATLADTLGDLRAGRLTVAAELDEPSRRHLARVAGEQRRLAWMVAAAGGAVAGVLAGAETPLGMGLLAIAGLSFLVAVLRRRGV